MTYIIQFTETDRAGRVQKYVMQYEATEMLECFSAHERLWLSEGKVIERPGKHATTEAVDLQAWFNRTRAL